jgi:hypothetical protein
MFKICHDLAEMSPVQSFSMRILLPQIATRKSRNHVRRMSIPFDCNCSKRNASVALRAEPYHTRYG